MRDDPLLYVKMKARRADEHFQALEREIETWIRSNPYSIIDYDDFKKALHICRIEIAPAPEIIPMLVGDFICCLRSSLDQLAWRLAHLPPTRTFTEREKRQIHFPIFGIQDDTYQSRRSLFPSAVASVIDTFQPYLRSNAFRDDPLWQLNELWTLDKHRTIPMNSNSMQIHFPLAGWEEYVRTDFEYHIEVHFPIAVFYAGNVHLKPSVSVEVLFGEYMGDFTVPMSRLGEVNNFVRNDVIPRFAGFFA
jgi:hypothetical protein